jgi:hypothetical protein
VNVFRPRSPWDLLNKNLVEPLYLPRDIPVRWQRLVGRSRDLSTKTQVLTGMFLNKLTDNEVGIEQETAWNSFKNLLDGLAHLFSLLPIHACHFSLAC